MQNTTIINLVFQGGSVKGAAYVGALRALEDYGIDLTKIKRVAGTSAGAITATALALGCDAQRSEQLLLEFDFRAVLDDAESFIPTQSKVLKSVEKQSQGKSAFFSKTPLKPILPVLLHRANTQLGIYDGEYIRIWAENLIQEQVKTITNGKCRGENLTFKELHQLTIDYPGKFRELLMVGANFTKGKKMLFCYDNPKTEDVIISDALRISMSIPQLFKPHHIHFKENGERLVDSRRDKWVDGGLYDNYPIDCFDAPQYLKEGQLCQSEDGRRLYNPQTLGFRLVSQEEKEYFEKGGEEPKKPLNNVIDYGKALLSARTDLQEERYAYPENIRRTIYIDNKNINTLAFNLTEEQRKALVLSGKEATENYLASRSFLSDSYPLSSAPQ